MKVTFFAESVVGYVDNPPALLTRGLAHGLALRGHDVRIVEPRMNAAFVRTLERAGAGAARHFHDAFQTVQHHTYEPRSGAPLLEWVARETALIDVAVAISGLDNELCRWIANVTREGLVRCYLAWSEADLQAERARELEIALYDLVLATFDVPTEVAASTGAIVETLAGADIEAGLASELPGGSDRALADPIDAAIAFEQAVRGARVLG